MLRSIGHFGLKAVIRRLRKVTKPPPYPQDLPASSVIWPSADVTCPTPRM